MSFLNTGALWWALLLVPLAILYFLKVRPEKHSTAILFLWDKVFREKQSSALFRRFRNWLSLLMLTLAFCAAIMAMAGLTFSGARSSKDFVLIIDNSASMGALDGGSTRLENARKAAANVIRNFLPSQRAVLAVAASSLKIVVGATSNQRELLEGLEKIRQSQEPLNVEALEFLKKREDFFKNSRALIFSDGCSLKGRESKSFEIVKIGKQLENAGIVAFDVTRLPDGENSMGLFFRTASSFKEKIKVDAVLCKDTRDNIIRVIPLELTPGINPATVMRIENAPAGSWLMYLDLKDALQIDNAVYAVLRDTIPVRVKVTPSSSRIYSLAVASFNLGKMLVRSEDKSDVTLISGKYHDYKSDKNYIIFNPAGKSPFWKSVGAEGSVDSVVVDLKDHPSIKFCNLDTVETGGVKPLVPPENAVIICRSGTGIPLIYRAQYGDKTAYVLNFSPEKADFFLNVNFPVMLCSMALDLAGEQQQLKSIYQNGQKLPEKLRKRFAGKTLELPDNKKEPIENDTSFALAGFYNLKNTVLGAALLSSSETLLNNAEVKSTDKEVEKGIPNTWWLFGIALLLLIVEEILYHRRKAG
jgi:hypothetical protein